MKNFSSVLKFGNRSVLLLFALMSGTNVFSQAGNATIPVVTVKATDPNASGPGNPGVFTVYRAGSTNETLNVWYDLDGTASNGVDYVLIPPHLVTIDAGLTSNNIVITPLASLTAGSAIKTVVLTLTNSPMLNPVNYEIGSPSQATVFIAPPGVSNLPPVVRITSPPNGSVFRAPLNLPLYAYAADPDGSVSTVEFFVGDTDLGPGQRVNAAPPPLPPGPIQPAILIVVSNYWQLVWTNVTLGTNLALTAKVTDNGGATTVSAPVFISVLPSLPLPTNRPALVGIVATDPVAIEGTNCWTWPGLTNSPPTWSNWAGASAALLPRFTNCGPKNATFTVFRSGATNDDLNVNYNIGGTARNGVDYVTITTNLTIPAGQLRAAITIVPLDDGPPDVTKTVILTLTTSSNYIIGIPRRAAVIIIDNGGPQPVAAMLPGNCFHLVTPGPNAAWFCVQCSTNLINWLPVCTNQVVNGSIDFIDPDAQTNPSRFYRAVPLTGPPAE